MHEAGGQEICSAAPRCPTRRDNQLAFAVAPDRRSHRANVVMRLLKRLPNGSLELVSFPDDDPPLYTILSHTWTDGQEVTYNELVSSSGKHKTGYDKIHFCVNRAAEDGLQYSWVD